MEELTYKISYAESDRIINALEQQVMPAISGVGNIVLVNKLRAQARAQMPNINEENKEPKTKK